MNKDDILKYCRYYKGQKANPYTDGDKALLWDYERKWVDDMSKEPDFSDYLSDYIAVGLRDFSMFDDVPITLKAMLFNRYAQSAYSMKDAVPGFKEFYQKYY